jgi:hypothetical protein
MGRHSSCDRSEVGRQEDKDRAEKCLQEWGAYHFGYTQSKKYNTFLDASTSKSRTTAGDTRKRIGGSQPLIVRDVPSTAPEPASARTAM